MDNIEVENMPICSYVIYPLKGNEERLKKTVATWDCVSQLYPATDQSVYILVTDTSNEKSEKIIKDKLSTCEDIECFTLTYANNE